MLRLRPEPCYALIAGALSYLTWSELTSGAWISAQWYAPYLPPVLALAVAGGLWIATLLLRRLPAPKPALVPAVLALAACALAYADARVLVGLYPSLHEALLLVLWLCGGEACARAIAQVVAPETRARRRAVLAVLACSLSLSVPIAWQKGTALQQRAVWMRAPGHAKVVYELGPSLVCRATRSGRDPSAYPASLEDWVDDQPDRARLTRPLATRAWSTLRNTQKQRAAAATAVATGEAPAEHPNVILISVDALRADVALRAPTGAFQSELVAKARVYRRAYAASAATHISLGTLVTGGLGQHEPARRAVAFRGELRDSLNRRARAAACR